MPLIMDNIVVFLFRVISLFLAERRSRNRPTTTGTVKDARSCEGPYPLVEITYVYRAEGNRYSGIYKKGFWYRGSAARFAERISSRDSQIPMRYRKDQQDRSFLLLD